MQTNPRIGRPPKLKIEDIYCVFELIREGRFVGEALKAKRINRRTFNNFLRTNDNKHLDAENRGLIAQLEEAELEGEINKLKNAASDMAKERPFDVVTVRETKDGIFKETKTIDNVPRSQAHFQALQKTIEMVRGQKFSVKMDGNMKHNHVVEFPELTSDQMLEIARAVVKENDETS